MFKRIIALKSWMKLSKRFIVGEMKHFLNGGIEPLGVTQLVRHIRHPFIW